MTTFISKTMLTELSKAAKASPRLRKNLNFHHDNEAQCHRLLNALALGTYVQPHCHLAPEKEESLVVLAGQIGLVIFSDDGRVVQTVVLAPNTENLGVTIPTGVFHSMLALQEDSVFFEAKAGPYKPISALEKAAWAPEEGTVGCADYLSQLHTLFV
ncbi:MAG: WbuC family cupin fold metalloprotein [Undibacterium sp.]|nr:WbuC family cupin fold metalloprotein [Undibacterium sp.]